LATKSPALADPLTLQQKKTLQQAAFRLTELEQAIQRAEAAGLDMSVIKLAQADLQSKVQALLQHYAPILSNQN